MTFSEIITNKFQDIVNKHQGNEAWTNSLFAQLGYTEADNLSEGVTVYDFLSSLEDGDEIYRKIWGYSATVKGLEDIPETNEVLTDAMKEAGEGFIETFSFAAEIIDDLAWECGDYDHPLEFFHTLQQHGCAGGMGPFMYNDGCKKFYVAHIDSLEDFISDVEEELGEHIENKEHLPHYVFACWFCFEELANRLAYELFEDEF